MILVVGTCSEEAQSKDMDSFLWDQKLIESITEEDCESFHTQFFSCMHFEVDGSTGKGRP